MISGRPESDVQVLLLEDNAADADLIRESLRKAGIAAIVRQVGHREDYVEALDARRPDVVLADRAVPELRGAEALRIARERYPDLPVIFVSGPMGDELASEVIKEGATDYVPKPQLARLGPAIRRVLEERAHDQQRERAEQQLRFIADALPSLISYIDTQWRYVFVNEAYNRWFGLAPPEIVGRRVWE